MFEIPKLKSCHVSVYCATKLCGLKKRNAKQVHEWLCKVELFAGNVFTKKKGHSLKNVNTRCDQRIQKQVACDLIIIEHGEKGNACETVKRYYVLNITMAKDSVDISRVWGLLLVCVSLKTLSESSKIVWIF